MYIREIYKVSIEPKRIYLWIFGLVKDNPFAPGLRSVRLPCGILLVQMIMFLEQITTGGNRWVPAVRIALSS
jgi:hypothetical protein